MASEQLGEVISRAAAADLSALQFRIMKLTDENTVNKTTAATDQPDGILYDKPSVAGRACRVVKTGLVKVEAGGDTAVGDILGSDANGKAVKIEPGSGTNNWMIGICQEGGADGQYIIVDLRIQIYQGQ